MCYVSSIFFVICEISHAVALFLLFFLIYRLEWTIKDQWMIKHYTEERGKDKPKVE